MPQELEIQVTIEGANNVYKLNSANRRYMESIDSSADSIRVPSLKLAWPTVPNEDRFLCHRALWSHIAVMISGLTSARLTGFDVVMVDPIKQRRVQIPPVEFRLSG